MARTYKSRIMAWDWDGIVRESQKNTKIDHECVDGCDSDGHVGSVYLGSVMALTPSGKFYTFWTTNQTADDVRRDTAWYTALEVVATKHGGWIESGEGDPTDLFFSRYWVTPNLNIN